MKSSWTAKGRRWAAIPAAAGSLALVLAACGSGSTASTEASSAPAEAAASAEAVAEASAPAESSEQEGAAACVIGFSNPTANNSYLGPLMDAMQKTVEGRGGTFIGIDAKVDPNKQISDIQTLISKGVNVLAAYPLDPRGVGPVLQQAADKGITLIGFNADIAKEVGQKPDAPYTGQIYDAFVSRPFAEEQVKWVADNIKGGKVIYHGLGVPVPSLERHADLVIEGLKGLTNVEYIGRTDSKTDDIDAAVAPIQAALTKDPDISVIFAYSDAGALGAAAALKALGRDGEVKIISSQLQDPGIQAVKDGKLDITYDFNNIVLGKTLGDMAMNACEKKDPASYETTVYPGVTAYTKDNIDSYVGWEQQLAELK